MRIVIDLQGAQTESRFRGIGRYVTSLTKALIRNGQSHEFFILLNGLFPETIQSIREQFKDILPANHVLVWHAPGPVQGTQHDNLTRRKIAELIRDNFIEGLEPDAVYVSSLFEGGDAVVNLTEKKKTYQIGITFYDLIPLLNPDQYFLGNPGFKAYYFDKLNCLKRADHLFAISEFSRREALENLGLEPESVINVSTASDEGVLTGVSLEAGSESALFQRLGITRPFILYTGGGDGRKNLPRLAQAYSMLPESLRNQYQLVMAGRMLQVQAQEIERAAKAAGLDVGKELLLTGYITDADLHLLYRHCRLFVFPSWHEGFGLPALEAMQCGAIVIAAGNTSLPEVLNFEAALFDPMDTKGMSEKMSYALQDESFRAAFAAHAQEQSKKFSWDTSAARLLKAFESRHRVNPNQKLKWSQKQAQYQTSKQQLLKGIAAILSAQKIDSEMERLAVAHALADNDLSLAPCLRAGVLPERIIWRVEGPFDSSYSLALLNRETARALSALGHEVVLHSTEGPGDFEPAKKFIGKNPDLAEMHGRSRVLEPALCDVSSRNLYPPRVHDMGSRMNLLHHYAWEETGFPQDWVDDFNDSLQGMTCLSNHVRKQMIDNGVKIPLTVSGCGVDHWDRIQPDGSFQLNLEGFVFLHVSSCFPRKGVGALLDAYGLAFKAGDPVHLVIKTFKNPHNETHTLLEECRNKYPAYPEVLVIEEDLTNEQLKALYEQSDVLVAPSRAEGFGLPLAEAMLAGLPVITTGWGGQTDFCNQETAWLIDYSYERAVTHFELFDSVWAAPDVPHLAKLLRELYTLPEAERARKNQAARELLASSFSWITVAQRLVDSARVFTVSQGEQPTRLGWVTSWKTPCGIASYSEHLIGAISHDVTVFARHETLDAPDEDNVIRCWNMSPEEDLQQLASAIEVRDINVLVVQFNYGFYSFPAFAAFLNRMTSRGIRVLVTLHATIDPPSIPDKQLFYLKDALEQCFRLLVHTPDDLNRLKYLGLDHKAAIFPHGVVDRPAPRITLPARVFKMASYGFFLPSKGLIELIDAVALLHHKGVRVHLTMVNAEYPIDISAQLIEKARNRIAFLGLEKSITLITDYLPEEQSFSLLDKADLIVFPYRESNESSSAAVRYGLATGKPVAVTPVHIFEDVTPAVFCLPDIDPGGMASGLFEIIEAMRLQAPGYTVSITRAHAWVDAHRYSALGQRLSNIVASAAVNA